MANNTDSSQILKQIFNFIGGLMNQSSGNKASDPNQPVRNRALENKSGQLDGVGKLVANLDGKGGELTGKETAAYKKFSDFDGNGGVSKEENYWSKCLLGAPDEIGNKSRERLTSIYNEQNNIPSKDTGSVFDENSPWDNANANIPAPNSGSPSPYSSTMNPLNKPGNSGRMFGFSINS